MDRKQNDWFLEVMSNPTFSNTEFKAVGLDATNSSLEDKEVYENNPKIRAKFMKNGVFDKDTFNATYNKAIYMYNTLAEDTYDSDMERYLSFSENNIFVDPKYRTEKFAPIVNFQGEPFKNNRQYTEGIYSLYGQNPTPYTVEEIAQTQKVLDPETGELQSAPNDAFFENFFDTRVLAQWDFDADKNGNPTNNPDEVVYYKGEYKLNDKGLPYYENLNGRSLVGKTVLHKSDILTTDGSFWNKFDFFDNDSIEKSTTGVIMKNLVTIAPMLLAGMSGLPGIIGGIYLGAGVALNTADFVTMGAKMLAGSDNKTINNIEGFLESVTLAPTKSDAKTSWTLNNFIDLGGDVFKQLAQQRWIFKYGPIFLKGNNKLTEENLNKLRDKSLKALEASREARLSSTGLKKTLDGDMVNPKWISDYQKYAIKDAFTADNTVKKYIESYNKLGEEISRLYMTGIVVADSYNDAKQQGLSDTEAALFTLGYGLGEYGILKSDIGKWILPELKLERYRNRRILETLAPKFTKAEGSLLPELAKQNKAKDLILKGLNKFSIDEKLGKKLSQFAIANALAEGVEETTEELLLDISKALFNASAYLRGDESRFNLFENAFDRYSMSFVGGMLGGGLFSLTPDLKAAYSQTIDMSSDQASKELLFKVKNGEKDKIIKQIRKLNFGSEYLSPEIYTDEKGNKTYKPGSSDNNQNLFIQDILINQVENMDKILRLSGLKISDNELLDSYTLGELRFSRLLNSSQPARFVNDVNSKIAQAAQLASDINSANSTLSKMQKDIKDTTNKEETQQREALDKSIQEKQKELDNLLQEIDDYRTGKKSNSYLLDSIFENLESINQPFLNVNYNRWLEAVLGKEYRYITEEEKQDNLSRYQEYLKGDFSQQVDIARRILDDLLYKISGTVTPEFVRSINSSSTLNDSIESILPTYRDIQDSNLLASTLDVSIYKILLERISPDLVNTYNEYLTKFEDLSKQLEQASEEDKENILNQISYEESNFVSFIKDSISNNKDTLINSIFNLSSDVKLALTNALNRLGLFEDDYNLFELIREIENSNTKQSLTSVIALALDKTTNVEELINNLDRNLYNTREDLSQFRIETKPIDEAINLIDLTIAALNAFRVTPNFDNLYNYSRLHNELMPDRGLLPEMAESDLESLFLDLYKQRKHLKFLKALSELNDETKLKVQENTAINTVNLLYKKIDKFYSYIQDWDGADKLREALDNVKAIGSVNPDSLDLEQERKNIELALHNLFILNKDKLDNVEEMSKIFSLEHFNFISDNNETLTEKSTDIDDNSFFWYLAGIAATNPNDFYFKYKGIITNEYAPLITQELATYIGYSQLNNKPIFDKFVRIKSNVLKTQQHSPTKFYSYEYVTDSGVYPRFGDIVFIEGVPGGGKSTAVWNNIVKMLGENHPLLNKVAFIHSSEENAATLAISPFVKEKEFFDKKKFLNKISSNYSKIVEEDNEVQTIKVENGKEINDYLYEEDGITKVKCNISTESSPYSLIVVDEISLWSTFDLDTLCEYCKKNNTRLIVLGDLQQTNTSGILEYKENNEDVTVILNLYRNNFIRSPKLGISMRSGYIQLIEAANALRAQQDNISNITFHYYEDEDGLYGVKVKPSDMIFNQDLEELINTSDEKVIFIYNDDNNPILKQIYDNNWQDKFDLRKGVTSSGIEGKYVVISLDDITFDEGYIKRIYTGVTRAKQGVLLITNDTNYTSVADTSTRRESYSPESITKYADKRLNVLNKVYSEGKPIKYITLNEIGEEIEEATEDFKNPDLAVPEEAITANSEDNITADKDNNKVYKESKKELKSAKTSDTNIYQDLYSFNTDNLVTDIDNQYKIDGLVGLQRVFPDIDTDVLTNLYYQLKTLFLYSQYNDIQPKLEKILGTKNTSFTLGFKITRRTKDEGGQGRFAIDGTSINLTNPNGNNEVPIKRVVVVINIDGKPAIEIPLLTLNSFKNFLYINENLSKIFQDFINLGKDLNERQDREKLNDPNLILEFIEYLKNINTRETETLIKMMYLYLYNDDSFIRLEDTKRFLNTLSSTGPVIRTTNIQNISDYATYTAQLFTLADMRNSSKRLLISTPMLLKDDLTDSNGNIIIKKGLPFIIISDNHLKLNSNSSDTEFVEALKEDFGNPKKSTSFMYINNPGMSVLDYLDYLYNANKNNSYNSNIGSVTTNLKILKIWFDYLKTKGLKDTNTPITLDSGLKFIPSEEDINVMNALYKFYNKYYNEDGTKKKGISSRIIIDELNNIMLGDNSLKKQINIVLLRHIKYLFTKDDSIDPNIADLIGNHNTFNQGVFIKVSFGNRVGNTEFYRIKTTSDKNSIEIDGNVYDFTLIGKLDPAIIRGDVSHILNKVDDNGEIETNNDFYLSDVIEQNNPSEQVNESEKDIFKQLKQSVLNIVNIPELNNVNSVDELVEILLNNGYIVNIIGDNISILDTSIGESISRLDISNPNNIEVYGKDSKLGDLRKNNEGNYDYYPVSKPRGIFIDQTIESPDMEALYSNRYTSIIKKNFTPEEKSNYERYYLTEGMINNIIKYFADKNQSVPKDVEDILAKYNYNLEENNCTSIISNIKSIIL